MTFKQLEQFLKNEKWRAGAQREADMCGKYARCIFCDRFGDYPCARAYDALAKRKKAGKAAITYYEFPEPDVRGTFGTDFASEEVSASDELAKVPVGFTDSYYSHTAARGTDLYVRPDYTKPRAADPGYGQPAPQPLPSAMGRLSAPAEGKDVIQKEAAPAEHAMIPYKTNEVKGARLLVFRRRVRN